MRLLLFAFSLAVFCANAQETIKSKPLRLRYTAPAGWTATEFGAKDSWETEGNALCRCSGLLFTKPNKNGKLNVLVYPSTQAGLDSAKRSRVGDLQFQDVEKFEKTRNKNFSFEKRRSSFSSKGSRSYDAIRYYAKVDDHFYIIYTWQDTMSPLEPQTEKELFEVVNALEPL